MAVNLAETFPHVVGDTSEQFWMEGPACGPNHAHLKLFGRHWKASGAKGTILLVHGYSEHSGRYFHFAKFLVQHGFDVITFDLPGHGRSEGRRSDIENFQDYV